MKEKNETLSRTVDRLRIGRKIHIHEHRREKRLTLDDLAAKTDIKKTILAKIENDEIVPPLGTLLKRSKVLDVSMASFFEDDVEMEKISITRSGVTHGFRALADQPARVLAVVWKE